MWLSAQCAISSLLLTRWMRRVGAEPSCWGHCGEWAGTNRDWCYCRDSCKEYNDCCSDFDWYCNNGLSCQGHCGTWVGTQSNWCDCSPSCIRNKNCCSDYEATCASTSCPKCPNDSYNCDEYADWGYTCSDLESKWGCDCSSCKIDCGPTPAPAPPPPAANLILLKKKKYPKARCLDGSMAGYYLRTGTANKYMLYFQGGGWCYDQNCDRPPTRKGTMKDCRDRSNTKLGSSKYWKEAMGDYDLSGMLSSDPETSPNFHNWTLVYLPYCDGTSFSGNAKVDDLHFRGSTILESIIAEIRANTGIHTAEQIVISGGSAGGTAVLYHSDKIAEVLGKDKVVALPDAGFFLDSPDKDGIDCWPAQMRSLFEVSKGYPALHAACLARFPEEPSKCMFPEYYGDLISTRTMVLQSFYDTSEESYTLRLNSKCPDDQWRCPLKDKQAFEKMRKDHMTAWSALVNKTGNGVWAISCPIHTMSWKAWTDTSWAVPEASGNTMAAAVKRWLEKNDTDGKDFMYEDDDWPANGVCLKSWHKKEVDQEIIFM